MFNNIYSLAGFSGGLEEDVKFFYPKSSVKYFRVSRDYSRLTLRFCQISINLFRIKERAPVLSAGGPVELISALVFSYFKSCHIFTPGVPRRYYWVVSLLTRYNQRSLKISTCDIEFNEKFPFTLLYNNNPFGLEGSHDLIKTSAIEKKFDVILIGRVDKNKRFQEFVNEAGDQAKLKKINLKILHIGDGVIHSGSSAIEVFSLGRVECQEIIFENIKKAKFLCISSVYESSPRVFWEATFLGTPVLATSCGNLRYISSLRCSESVADLVSMLINLLNSSPTFLQEMAMCQYNDANMAFYHVRKCI